MNKLKLEVEHDLVRGYNPQIKAANMPFDRKIDRILEVAEPQQERTQGHILGQEPPDRGDR